jgi:hypothetical protein
VPRLGTSVRVVLRRLLGERGDVFDDAIRHRGQHRPHLVGRRLQRPPTPGQRGRCRLVLVGHG